MHYLDLREAQKSELVNTDPNLHKWEVDTVPVLHSGFTTGCIDNPSKQILYLSVFYSDGSYMCRLQDRTTKEIAFLEVKGLKGLFQELEQKLKTGKLAWKSEKKWQGNGSARS